MNLCESKSGNIKNMSLQFCFFTSIISIEILSSDQIRPCRLLSIFVRVIVSKTGAGDKTTEWDKTNRWCVMATPAIQQHWCGWTIYCNNKIQITIEWLNKVIAQFSSLSCPTFLSFYRSTRPQKDQYSIKHVLCKLKPTPVNLINQV